MLGTGTDRRSVSPRIALAGLLAAAMLLVAPQGAAATGNVTVSVDPPQFDPKDGNYAVFSGSVTNAPSPDSDSGCTPPAGTGCVAQFIVYPAGVPGSLVIGPQLTWGEQGGPNPSPVSVTINLSTSTDIFPGSYGVALRAYDTSGLTWESAQVPFEWPPDRLDLSDVRLGETSSGRSTISYELDDGGTPFRRKARVAGSVFDGAKKLGSFTHKVRTGDLTRLLPGSIHRKLVEGRRYRVRLDAEDRLDREARFRGKLTR